jgi:hypothetical protein
MWSCISIPPPTLTSLWRMQFLVFTVKFFKSVCNRLVKNFEEFLSVNFYSVAGALNFKME